MTRPIPLMATPPFNPIHDGLYSGEELLAGYDPATPVSVVNSLDYRAYIYFQQQGRTTVTDPYAAMMESVHDASIVRGMNAFLATHLANGRRPVAIMGGHNEARGSKTYRSVAQIAKLLSEYGFVVASGGGPGCMEASHLGALFAHAGDDELTAAVDMLEKAQASLPTTMGQVLVQDPGTKQWSIDDTNAADLAKWMEPARLIYEARKPHLTVDNQSLAVPTWHYGHEPFTPLATHIAKYFLNSIREDVLLALATSGIVYSEGRGGTMQEVFQDAAQIYYRDTAPISSMVFLDSNFWTAPAQPDGKIHLPVLDLLHRLFVDGKKMTDAEFRQFVRVADDPGDVLKIIIDNAPPLASVLQALSDVGMPDFSPGEITEASAKALAFTGS